MNVVVAGGHGQIAMLLHPLLKDCGHEVRALIRNPEHAGEVCTTGAQPEHCDLEAETDVAKFLSKADAIVFAAGAGPGSGAARKFSMDRDGAIKLIDAAQQVGVRRFVMISAMNAEEPRGDDVFQAYLRAKAEADDALRKSGLDYTIVRPGRLSNERGSGHVRIAQQLPRAEIPRADVAAVIVQVLQMPSTVGHQFDVTSGDMEISAALASAV